MNYIYLDEVDSTNKYSKEHISSIPDMSVVYTYKQTAGRGRLQRTWNFLGQDNIYASIILKPSDRMQEVYSNLTQLLCVILAEVFEEYGVEAKIKWPNDIKISDKKISGILAETVYQGQVLEGIVLGFGVNLNADKDSISNINQPATSLNIEIGEHVDKEKFFKKVINKFCLIYNRFIEEGFLLIREDYKKRANFLNKQVSVKVFDKTYVGIAEDVTENGALQLFNIDSREKHILLIGDIL